MITNATLQRIDVPQTVADSSKVLVQGSAISIRVALDERKAVRYGSLPEVVKDGDATMYLQGTSAMAIADEGRVLVLRDGDDAAGLYVVVHVEPRSKGSISHKEIYLQQIP